MYCPTCGSEERQLSQYCRACGTDLRVVRIGLESPDAITASAVSAREHISRAIADKIRQTQSTSDLQNVAENVLPEIEKFLESPEEKRLRRIRAGVILASLGLGGTLIAFLLSMIESDFLPLIGLGGVFFFIGVGIIINGLAFSVPRKDLPNFSEEALAQKALDSQAKNAVLSPAAILKSATNERAAGELTPVLSSVTEHTTHQLKVNR